MNGLSKAIAACSSEAELARRLTARLGRQIRSGHVYSWKKSGFSLAAREDVIPAIEAVTDGAVRVEELCPEVVWQRDADGIPTHYLTPLPPPSNPTPEQAAP